MYGLSEKELPRDLCQDGILILPPLKGFCYGGIQNADSETVGYVVFMRNETNAETKESNDQRNHEIYRNEVMGPYIQSVRKKFSNGLWKENMPVPDDMTWVAWQDGHGPGLKAIIKESQQITDKAMKLVTCKHAGSSTGTTQACDMSP